jgi:hypothetical protein
MRLTISPELVAQAWAEHQKLKSGGLRACYNRK